MPVALKMQMSPRVPDVRAGKQHTVDDLTRNFDVFLACHEYENISWWKGKVNLQNLFHCAIDVVFAR